MKRTLTSLFLSFLVCLWTVAQEPATAPPEEKPVENSSLVKINGTVRLDGLWEIHVDGKNTGVEIEIRQITYRFHATVAKPPPNSKTKPGTDFVWGSVKGMGGTGTAFTVEKTDDGKIVDKKEPVSFTIDESGERVHIVIENDKLGKNSLKEFDLVRIGRVKLMRLYTVGSDGLQETNSVYEDQPMVVELEHSNPNPSPVQVTLKSGANTLELTARKVTWSEVEKPPKESAKKPLKLGLLRTEPFLPTFAGQFGVEPVSEEDPSGPEGRAPTEADWGIIDGDWQIAYHDKELGVIEGWVRVWQHGDVKVLLKEPESGFWKRLELEDDSVRVTDSILVPAEGDVIEVPKLKMTFSGTGVRSAKRESKKSEVGDQLKLILDPDDTQTVAFAAEKLSADVPLQRWEPADRDQVTLELQTGKMLGGKSMALYWDWKYKARRETERDAGGFGRAGTLVPIEEKEESPVAWMKGREVWRRSQPQVLQTIVISDQLGLVDGLDIPKHRYKPMEYKGLYGGKATMKTWDDGGRPLFILARNLPPHELGSLLLFPVDNASIESYQFKTRDTDPDPGINAAELAAGWDKFRKLRQQRNPDQGAIEGAEGIYVSARAKEVASPGWQRYAFNHRHTKTAVGKWNLLYGDTTGQIEFVRELADGKNGEKGEWETIDEIYLPEVIHVGIRTRVPDEGIDSFPAELSAYDPDTDKLLYKTELTLTRSASDDRMYLSTPIPVEDPLPEGTLLKTNIPKKEETGFIINPFVAEARVLAPPLGDETEWRRAVKRAANVAGVELTDWDKVTARKSTSISNLIITEGGSRSIDISVGDHAAMFVLRNEFIRMTTEQIVDWKRNQSMNARVRVFLGSKEEIASRNSPLSYTKIAPRKLPSFKRDSIEFTQAAYEELSRVFSSPWTLAREVTPGLQLVTDETTLDYPLHQIFEDGFFNKEFGADFPPGQIEVLKWEAFDQAFQQWGPGMQKSITAIERIPDDDIAGLLEKTGLGFDRVVKRVIPRMVRPSNDNPKEGEVIRWIPDTVARYHINALAVTGSAVRAQADYSSTDTTLVLSIAAAASGPLVSVGGIWTGIGLSVSGLDFAHSLYVDGALGYLNKGNYEDFERGAMAALGNDRIEQVDAGDFGWMDLLSIGGAAVGFGVDANDALKIYKAAKAAKAVRALSNAEFADESARVFRELGELGDIRKLPLEDQAILGRLFEDIQSGAITDPRLVGWASDQGDELTAFLKESGFRGPSTKKAKPIAQANEATGGNRVLPTSDEADDLMVQSQDEIWEAAERGKDVSREAAEAAVEEVPRQPRGRTEPEVAPDIDLAADDTTADAASRKLADRESRRVAELVEQQKKAVDRFNKELQADGIYSTGQGPGGGSVRPTVNQRGLRGRRLAANQRKIEDAAYLALENEAIPKGVVGDILEKNLNPHILAGHEAGQQEALSLLNTALNRAAGKRSISEMSDSTRSLVSRLLDKNPSPRDIETLAMKSDDYIASLQRFGAFSPQNDEFIPALKGPQRRRLEKLRADHLKSQSIARKLSKGEAIDDFDDLRFIQNQISEKGQNYLDEFAGNHFPDGNPPAGFDDLRRATDRMTGYREELEGVVDRVRRHEATEADQRWIERQIDDFAGDDRDFFKRAKELTSAETGEIENLRKFEADGDFSRIEKYSAESVVKRELRLDQLSGREFLDDPLSVERILDEFGAPKLDDLTFEEEVAIRAAANRRREAEEIFLKKTQEIADAKLTRQSIRELESTDPNSPALAELRRIEDEAKGQLKVAQDELFAEASKIYQEQGIRTEIGEVAGNRGLIFSPEGSHPVNRFAKNLLEEHGTQYADFPELFAGKPSRKGVFVHGDKIADGKGYHALALNPNSRGAADLGRSELEEALPHEGGHLFSKNRPGAPMNARFRGNNLTNKDAYRSYYSMDETRSYGLNARQSLERIARGIEEGRHTTLGGELKTLRKRVDTIREFAEASEKNLKLFEKVGESGSGVKVTVRSDLENAIELTHTPSKTTLQLELDETDQLWLDEFVRTRSTSAESSLVNRIKKRVENLQGRVEDLKFITGSLKSDLEAPLQDLFPTNLRKMGDNIIAVTTDEIPGIY